MRILSGIVLLGLGLTRVAFAADTIPATGGVITITPIAHASVQIEHAGKVIQVDPWSVPGFSSTKPADLILITDGTSGHHFDPKAIQELRKPGAPVVGPATAKAKMPETVALTYGQTTMAAGIRIEAIGAYDITQLDKPGEPSHPKGESNGYLFTLGGKRIYVAGVTECVPEMRALKNIDLMFVAVNLPLERMNPSAAAECIKAVQPKVVYPLHFDNAGASRMQNPKSNASQADSDANRATVEAFKKLLAGEPIEVRIAALYPVPAPSVAAQSYPPPFPRQNATKLLETDRIVVWNVVWPMGQPSPMHKHIYDQVGTYYVPGGRVITSPDGSKRTGSTPVGNISTTRKGTLHIEEGNTDPPLRAVFIELKYEQPLQASGAASETPPSFPRDGAKQVFDDERVTIWDYTFTRGSRPAHRYDRDTLIVFLGDGYVRWTARDGQPTVLKAAPGQVRYVPRASVETEEVLDGSPRGIIFSLK